MRRTAESRRLQTGLKSDLSAVLRPILGNALQVASFVGAGLEPCVAPRPGWLLPILLPDGDLDWARDDGRYVLTSLGIREPSGPRLGVEAIADCDLVLVPALLVDYAGYRLGRGGGSYDRALLRATGQVVALINDDELVEALPREPHDVQVDAVATPGRGMIALPRAAPAE